MITKKLLPLIVAPLISCGCPTKNPPETSGTAPTPVPTVTAEPTASAPEPKPEPKPSIAWKKASDEEVLDMAKAGACLLILFKSEDQYMNEAMDKVLAAEDVISVVNERFVPMVWDGSDEIRVGFFGVKKNRSNLLVTPTDSSSYLLFDAFDKDGVLQATPEQVAVELASGLNLKVFAPCVEAKQKVTQ